MLSKWQYKDQIVKKIFDIFSKNVKNHPGTPTNMTSSGQELCWRPMYMMRMTCTTFQATKAKEVIFLEKKVLAKP